MNGSLFYSNKGIVQCYVFLLCLHAFVHFCLHIINT